MVLSCAIYAPDQPDVLHDNSIKDNTGLSRLWWRGYFTDLVSNDHAVSSLYVLFGKVFLGTESLASTLAIKEHGAA